MKYETVQQLKKAKFPNFEFKESIMGDDTYNYPSLQQLIDACGDDFYALSKDANEPEKWFAMTETGQFTQSGSTYLEAVAKLWL